MSTPALQNFNNLMTRRKYLQCFSESRSVLLYNLSQTVTFALLATPYHDYHHIFLHHHQNHHHLRHHHNLSPVLCSRHHMTKLSNFALLSFASRCLDIQGAQYSSHIMIACTATLAHKAILNFNQLPQIAVLTIKEINY